MASTAADVTQALSITSTVKCAGGVVYRPHKAGAVQVLVVHRREADDWGLPKGKVYPWETAEQAALREVKEETGLRCRLVKALGCDARQDRRGRWKATWYWLMAPLGGRFDANNEVDDARWLRLGKAADQLAEHERAVLRRAEALGATAGLWPQQARR
jgi:8-oxo-dGTP diphosphatase